MTNADWPDEVMQELSGFYEELSLSDRHRESIVRMRSSELETRKWKRTAGALAASLLVVVTLGIYAFVKQDPDTNRDEIVRDQPRVEDTIADNEANGPTTHTVSLEVPTMVCSINCWPKVRKTLEAEPGVEFVLLAAQKQKDDIDNRVVHVAVDDRFSPRRAMAALARAGFTGSSVKEP